MDGTDGLPGSGFDRQWLQNVLFANRHYSAEIMLDGVLRSARNEGPIVDVGGVPVDVTEACDVLAAWDRRNNDRERRPAPLDRVVEARDAASARRNAYTRCRSIRRTR